MQFIEPAAATKHAPLATLFDAMDALIRQLEASPALTTELGERAPGEAEWLSPDRGKVFLQ